MVGARRGAAVSFLLWPAKVLMSARTLRQQGSGHEYEADCSSSCTEGVLLDRAGQLEVEPHRLKRTGLGLIRCAPDNPEGAHIPCKDFGPQSQN